MIKKIFFIIFSFFLLTYLSELRNIDEKMTTTKLNFYSEEICFLLSKTKGIPTNWETDLTNLKIPGLLKISENTMKLEKMNVFDTQYSTIKKKFNCMILIF